jgi:hypothetical protein
MRPAGRAGNQATAGDAVVVRADHAPESQCGRLLRCGIGQQVYLHHACYPVIAIAAHPDQRGTGCPPAPRGAVSDARQPATIRARWGQRHEMDRPRGTRHLVLSQPLLVHTQPVRTGTQEH